MTLNLISNFAANVALLNLQLNGDAATSSVAKLSSGQRVVTAADDAASLAIGSRLRTEVLSLGQAQVNAGQASSLLQIADGALARVQDILTRAKVLAVQSGSKNLGDTERALLDTEYQNLLEEIDRIANDTEFNGAKLLTRENGVGISGTGFAAEGAATGTNGGVINVTAREFLNKDLTDGGDGSFLIAFTANSNANDITFGAQATSEGGATLTFSATINSELITNAGNTSQADLITGTTLNFTRDAVTGTGTTLTEFTQDNAAIVLSLDESYNVATLFGAGVGTGSFALNTSTTGPAEEFTFKVGTGILPSEDNIQLTISGITTENLGIANSDITTFARSDSANQAIAQALDFLVNVRSDVGASINRLDAASRNIATTLENSEAARSVLLDLDVAAEITTFTNKQILVQAGISVLAQANQLPQNLLRLFA